MNASVRIPSTRTSNPYFFLQILVQKWVTIKGSKIIATSVVSGGLLLIQIGPKSFLHGGASCSGRCFYTSFSHFLAPMLFFISFSFVFGTKIIPKSTQIHLIGTKIIPKGIPDSFHRCVNPNDGPAKVLVSFVSR